MTSQLEERVEAFERALSRASGVKILCKYCRDEFETNADWDKHHCTIKEKMAKVTEVWIRHDEKESFNKGYKAGIEKFFSQIQEYGENKYTELARVGTLVEDYGDKAAIEVNEYFIVIETIKSQLLKEANQLIEGREDV